VVGIRAIQVYRTCSCLRQLHRLIRAGQGTLTRQTYFVIRMDSYWQTSVRIKSRAPGRYP